MALDKKEALNKAETGVLIYLICADALKVQEATKYPELSFELSDRGMSLNTTVESLKHPKFSDLISPMLADQPDFSAMPKNNKLANPYQSMREEIRVAVKHLLEKHYITAYTHNTRGAKLIPNLSGIDVLMEKGTLVASPAMDSYRDFLAKEKRDAKPRPIHAVGRSNKDKQFSQVSISNAAVSMAKASSKRAKIVSPESDISSGNEL